MLSTPVHAALLRAPVQMKAVGKTESASGEQLPRCATESSRENDNGDEALEVGVCRPPSVGTAWVD